MEHKAIKIEPKDDHNAEKQHPNQPPKIVTKLRGGQKLEYIFVNIVKSVDELDKLRFKNSCLMGMGGCRPLPKFGSHIMPCTRKYKLEKCEFELLALRQENGIIDVYAHSKHNHPIMPEERRQSLNNPKEFILMPAENPPRIYRTEDNTEWKFVQTLNDYGQLQKFQRKSQCIISTGRESNRRIRQPCRRRGSHNCQFKLLALKTTEQGYHVYAFGEHNHPAIKPKKRQQRVARGHQQKQQEMEVDEKDGQEEGAGQDEPIEEGGGGGEEENGIIVIDDDDGIKVEQHPKVKQEGAMDKTTGTPQGNEAPPKEETLEETLKKAEVKGYYEWMARFEPTQIEPKVMGMDTASRLKMVEMADQEVRNHPAKFDKWRPWLKHVMPKCMSEVEDFYSKYKHLTGLMFRHVKD